MASDTPLFATTLVSEIESLVHVTRWSRAAEWRVAVARNVKLAVELFISRGSKRAHDVAPCWRRAVRGLCPAGVVHGSEPIRRVSQAFRQICTEKAKV